MPTSTALTDSSNSSLISSVVLLSTIWSVTGETINSLQTIISLIYRQKTGDWKRIVVNIGDWREKQEERLKSLAEQTSARAIETGEV